MLESNKKKKNYRKLLKALGKKRNKKNYLLIIFVKKFPDFSIALIRVVTGFPPFDVTGCYHGEDLGGLLLFASNTKGCDLCEEILIYKFKIMHTYLNIYIPKVLFNCYSLWLRRLNICRCHHQAKNNKTNSFILRRVKLFSSRFLL